MLRKILRTEYYGAKIKPMEKTRNKPIPHQLYRHFKGNLYQVQCIANHSETGEEMVVYQALYGDYRFFVRPLDMFMEKVDKIKYPDATQEYRFEPIDAVNRRDEKIQESSSVDQKANSQNGEDSSGVENVACNEDTREKAEGWDENLDADVIKFLDADTYEQRLEILTGMKYRITNQMIDIMSTVIDIEIHSGDVEKRYEDFKNALMTRKHYEGVRLR